MLKAFHHFGLVVNNLDRSIRFYTEVLGLEFATSISPWRTGVRGARLRHVCLSLNGIMLELLEFEKGEVVPANYDTGATHLAFQVDDVKLTKVRLEEKGLVLGEINRVTEGILRGWCWTYINDPDGYTVELVEVTKSE